jgi:magnesium transporter
MSSVSSTADDLNSKRGGRRRIGPSTVSAVPRMRPDATVAEARTAITGGDFGYSGHFALLDEERFVGAVAAERVLVATPTARLVTLADTSVPRTTPAEFEETAASTAARSGHSVIAVVDAEGLFHGFVPPARILQALANEHEEDVARFAGVLARSTQVRLALEERIELRLWHRTPWLVIGLAGAMASAVLTSSFEDEIARNVVLAFYLPAVVYLADAVGTQTEALVIRGISQGVALRSILIREAATGLLIGGILATAFLPFSLAIGGGMRLGLAVSLSLLVSCVTATLVALSLPYGFARLGRDPAFGSGPLSTVIQDLLSIAVYFGLAVSVV